jgi:hypothetical protein
VAFYKDPNVVAILTKPWDGERLRITVSTAIARNKRRHVGEPV